DTRASRQLPAYHLRIGIRNIEVPPFHPGDQTRFGRVEPESDEGNPNRDRGSFDRRSIGRIREDGVGDRRVTVAHDRRGTFADRLVHAPGYVVGVAFWSETLVRCDAAQPLANLVAADDDRARRGANRGCELL